MNARFRARGGVHDAVAVRVAFVVLLVACFGSPVATAETYFPFAARALWTLKAAGAPGPVTVEVVEHQVDATTLRFRTPWSENQWRLAPQGERYVLTGYGTATQIANVPGNVPFFDFTRPVGASWSGAMGRMEVVAKGVDVVAVNKTYRNAVQQRQTAGGSSFTYTFAPDVGLVQFQAGPYTFMLDEASSRLDFSAPAAAAPHQPTAVAGSELESLSRHPLAPAKPRALSDKLLVGVTVNTTANESATPTNLLKRYDQTVKAGVSYVSGAGLWTELEPSPGRYDFQSIDFQVSEAKRNGLLVSYTLRVIDTVVRRMPSDLESRRWNDPEVERRALRLVEGIVGRFRGQVKWFMFGNEIDGYFQRQPGEIADFAALFAKLRTRVKELAPDVAFSTTLMFAGADASLTSLAAVDKSCDALALTYYPMQGDFTVQDPSVAARDFERMRRLARGRGVLLQEIGYPTGAINASSQQKQADFYANVFAAMRANRGVIEAGSFFALADLSNTATRNLSSYYGIGDVAVFKSFLQTLGMFDGTGAPKLSWAVFTHELAR